MKMIKVASLACYLVLVGCVSGPKLSELPPIPEYGNTLLTCSIPVEVAVMPAFDLRAPKQQGKNKQGLIIKTIGTSFPPEDAINILVEVLSEESNASIFVTDSNRTSYISREQRLQIGKIIVLKSFAFENSYGSDGTYLDASITLDLYERDNQHIIKSIDILGRIQILEKGDGIQKFPSPQLAERLKQAYKSLLKYSEFMKFICNEGDVGDVGEVKR